MIYSFNIKNDRLIQGGYLTGNTGNVNSYICSFSIECNIEGLTWFCIFKQNEKIYRQVIENDCCYVPYEVLTEPGTVEIGCYGVSAGEELTRVSTNMAILNIKQGAYSDASVPDAPEPDVWEMLVSRTVPVIGENGNWYIYDMQSGDYTDSGKPSRGEQGEKGEKGDKGEQGDAGAAGYTPQKGIDYWTAEDKEEIRSYVESAILGGAW